MKNNPPTHDAIAERARKVWAAEGNPTGRDTAIWLSAEQQLSIPPEEKIPGAVPLSPAQIAAKLTSETAAESVVEFHLPSSTSEDAAVRAALQTPESRGTPPPDKTAPQLAATSQVRGASTAQSTATPATDPAPATPAPTTPAAPASLPHKTARAPQFRLKKAPESPRLAGRAQ